jgi:ribonuclease HI
VTGGQPEREVITVFCDGGARGNPGPAAIGAVILDPTTTPATRLATVSERIGVATNNVAEYKAVIAGLEAARAFPARTIQVRADSMLVIRQLEGKWKVKHANLRPLHEAAKQLLANYQQVDLAHVRREQNTDADLLVNAALDAAP